MYKKPSSSLWSSYTSDISAAAHNTISLGLEYSAMPTLQSVAKDVTTVNVLTCGRQHVLDKHENGFLRADFDPFADNIHKLSYCQVSWNQIPAE